MNKILHRILGFAALAVASAAFGAVAVPPSDITPVPSGTIIGRTSPGTGRAEIISAGDNITIANGVISASGGGGGGAPTTATYITQTPNGTLTNEQALSLLGSGIMYVTTSTGVVTSLSIPLASNFGGTGVTSLGTGVSTWFVTPSAANLRAAVPQTTGTGSLVFNDSPSFTTFLGLPTSATPSTASAGHASFDTNAWAGARGALQINDGTSNTYVVAVQASDTPSNGQVPMFNTNGTITWETGPGGGNVTGPGSSTANAVVTWNGTSGTSIANSQLITSSSGNFPIEISPNAGRWVLANVTTNNTGNNAVTIQAAFDAGAKYVVLPAGQIRTTSTIAKPPGAQLIGQGDYQTELIYTGTGRAVTSYGGDLLSEGIISGIKFTATAAATALVSFSDSYRQIVENCTFTGSAAIGIELRNQTTWTEGARILNCYARDLLTGIFFNIDGGTSSFAETSIRDYSFVASVVGARGIVADANSDIYASDINIKVNQEVDAATIPTTTKSIIIELGAAAKIRYGKLFVFSENTGVDRNFTRFKLAASAYISADGYQQVAGATGMSLLVGATNPFDDLDATAALYLGPGGEFVTGAAGPARASSGSMIYAQRAQGSNVETPVVYVPAAASTINLRYVGTGRVHTLTLKVASNQFADVSANSSSLRIVEDQAYNNQPVFNRSNPPYLKFSTDGNPFLYVDMNNTVSDGILSITATIDSFMNAGSTTNFGSLKPIVIFPDMSGITVGSAISPAASFLPVSGNIAVTGNNIALGNVTSGLYENIILANGTNVTFTKNSTTLTISSAGGGGGGGNVTGPGSSVNNRMVTWSGTAGTAIQDATSFTVSGNTITSSGNVSIAGGGTNQNIVLTPSGTGETRLVGPGNVTGNLTIGGNILSSATANTILMANGTALAPEILTAGSNVTFTKNATHFTISASGGGGGGNVSANATLTGGNVVVGNGTTNVISSNMSYAGTNLTIGTDGFNPGAIRLQSAAPALTTLIPTSGSNGTLYLPSSGYLAVAASPLTTGNIIVGDSSGSSGIATSNISWNATNNTITAPNGNITGNLAVGGDVAITGNTTFGNLTTATLNVTGNVTVATATTNTILLGNSTGYLNPRILTAGANMTFSSNSTALTIDSVAGTGNVTAAGTLASGNIVIGQGTKATATTNITTSGNLTTFPGNIVAGGSVEFTATLGTDDTFRGTTLSGLNAGATIAQWEAVYLDGSSTWQLADANGSGTYPARGLAVAGYSSSNAAVILREGTVRNDAWNWTIGGTIYLSTTAGGLTQSAPATSGDKVQQVGFALTADIAYFNFASGEFVQVQ